MDKVAEATIEDVSAEHGPLAPGERVFRSASGYLVLVATRRIPGGGDRLHFRFAGSLDGASPPIVTEHALTIHAESAVDVAAEVQGARELVVRRLEQSAIHHAAAASLEGVA